MRNYLKGLILLLPLLLLSYRSYADLGPKPTAEISVKYNGFPVIGNFEARMLTCLTPRLDLDGSCSTFKSDNCKFDQNKSDNLTSLKDFLLKDIPGKCYWRPTGMAWGGECKASSCHFSYFLPEQFRLAVKLPTSERIFVTNLIDRPNFDSTYSVNLKSDGTGVIKDTTLAFGNSKAKIFIAFVLTVLIEWIVSLVIFRKVIFKPVFLLPLLIGNAVTFPIVWFFSTMFLNISYYWIILAITEILAFYIESSVYYIFYRRQTSPMKLYMYTLLANLSSFLAGLFIS